MAEGTVDSEATVTTLATITTSVILALCSSWSSWPFLERVRPS